MLDTRTHKELTSAVTQWWLWGENRQTSPNNNHILATNWLMWYDFILLRVYKELNMATKAKKKAEFTWKGYVNVEIPMEKFGAAERYIADTEAVWTALTRALVSGYKLSVDYNVEGDSYKATLVCHDEKSPNFGFALSGWGITTFDAIGAVLFKHFVIVGANWDAAVKPSNKRFG